VALGAPWAHIGSTLDPDLIPSLTPRPTLTPLPSPTPTATPEPTETLIPLAALVSGTDVVPPGGPCVRDQVILQQMQAVGVGQQGHNASLVSLLFCLQSQPEAVVAVGLVPAGLSQPWQTLNINRLTASSRPSAVSRGDGSVVQVLEWRAIPPGRYWLVAVLADPQDLRVLAIGPGPEITLGAGP
jgi:hypothetical protein